MSTTYLPSVSVKGRNSNGTLACVAAEVRDVADYGA